MDFDKYLQQEFGVNHQNSHLSSNEIAYYTALSEKFYEENIFLGIASLFLGSVILISFSILSLEKNTPNIALLLSAISGITIFTAIIFTAIANSLFTHFKMISFKSIANCNRIMSAINKAYVYKQTAKVLFLSSLVVVMITICLLLALNIKVLFAFFICMISLYLAINHYINKVRISAQERTMSKLNPILDADNPSIFSDIAIKVNNTQNEHEEKDRILSSLMSVLDNPSPKVRLQAIKFLARHATIESIDTIINMLGDTSPAVRAQAALVLGRFGERNVKEALKSLLYDENADVRKASAESLGRLRVGSSSNILVSLLNDSVSEVRACAAEALGNIKKVKTLKSLSEIIDDEDSLVRCKVIIALRKFATHLSNDIIQKIILMINDDNQNVQNATRVTLEKLMTHIKNDDEMHQKIQETLDSIVQKSTDVGKNDTNKVDSSKIEKNDQDEMDNAEIEAEDSEIEAEDSEIEAEDSEIETEIETEDEKITLEEDIDTEDMENW